MSKTICEFIVLVEDKADYETAAGIAEKVIFQNAPEWVKDNFEYRYSSVFAWKGLDANTNYTRWIDYKILEEQFKEKGYKPPHFTGHKNYSGYDYSIGRKFLQLIEFVNREAQREILAVLMIRDADNQAYERKKSLYALLEDYSDLVIGLSIPKRESWVLNGFEPQTELEHQSLNKVISRLGFNPCIDSYRLKGSVSQPGTEHRDIKQVLSELVGSDYERETQCWNHTSIEVLTERGAKSGLTEYIENINRFLLPILNHHCYVEK